VDFRLGERSEAFRAEVQEFLDEHWTQQGVERAHDTGTYHDWTIHRALAAQGWLGAAWPKELGGQARDSFEMAVFHEELSRRQVPVDGMAMALMVAGVIREVGSDEQRASIIPRVLRGEILIALGYSEPEAGSDVAAAATRARRDGDEWVIDGQKMFTTLAHEAHYVFLLTRTNSEVPKHKGLTMFLVPMDSAGIELQPIHTLGGERTNITFYDGVRVPDACRVGPIDEGWRVMQVALAFERGSAMGAEMARHLRRAVEWAAGSDDDQGRSRLADPTVRATLANGAIRAEVARLLSLRTTWGAQRSGVPSHVHGSMAKLFASESMVRTASELLDLLGAEGQLQHGAAGAPAEGWLEQAFRHLQVTTIYGGTSEVQRSIIAEAGLGLPRSR
jgi:alkylation response protein AidB-like acyl-CoA dehydrogenase